MAMRGYLIHAMLITLWLAGTGAAWAAVKGGDADQAKVVETGLACLIATAFIIPCCGQADRKDTRFQGLVGMTIVMLMFATSLTLIWGLVEHWAGSNVERKLWWTLCWVAATGVPGAFKLRLVRTREHWLAGRFGVGLSIVVLVLLLLGTWYRSDELDEHMVGTAGALSVTGIVATIALCGAGIRPRRYWRWIGVLAAAVAATKVIFDIWHDTHTDALEWVRVISMCVAGATAHAIVCLLIPLTSLQRWLRVLSIVFACSAAASVSASSWGTSHHKEWNLLDRSTAAAGILTCCGTLSLLVLARVNRGLDRRPTLNQIGQMALICPGCHSYETVALGKSACSSCGLVLTVGVEEPHCPRCDYLLYMHRGSRCPECGLELGESGAAQGGLLESKASAL